MLVSNNEWNNICGKKKRWLGERFLRLSNSMNMYKNNHRKHSTMHSTFVDSKMNIIRALVVLIALNAPVPMTEWAEKPNRLKNMESCGKWYQIEILAENSFLSIDALNDDISGYIFLWLLHRSICSNCKKCMFQVFAVVIPTFDQFFHIRWCCTCATVSNCEFRRTYNPRPTTMKFSCA